jgi:hypothetical protein
VTSDIDGNVSVLYMDLTVINVGNIQVAVVYRLGLDCGVGEGMGVRRYKMCLLLQKWKSSRAGIKIYGDEKLMKI